VKGGASGIGYYLLKRARAPVARLNGPYTGNEGSLIVFDASASSDPDGDLLQYRWDFDSDETWDTLWSSSPTANYTWYDDYAGTVTVEVKDTGGLSDADTAPVAVDNVAPVITSLICPVEPVEVATTVAVSATFMDQGTLDTHTAMWYWGDETSSAGTLIDAFTVNGSHIYTSAGVYAIRLEVTDDDGGSATRTCDGYVVIYDPTGDFVTGGGWINSPAGAYTADPTLTGKATFGFVSKYKKGANVPTGNTEFHFHVASMNFKSMSYEWLVVAGARAQYKGVGVINGEGNYGFMLTTIDGKINGGGGVDKFRIKIWDIETSEIVYDNMLGASDTATVTTAISAGSIIIHK